MKQRFMPVLRQELCSRQCWLSDTKLRQGLCPRQPGWDFMKQRFMPVLCKMFAVMSRSVDMPIKKDA